MTTVEYYRRSIVMPLLIPVLAIPQYAYGYRECLEKVIYPFGGGPPTQALALFLVGSFFWGGAAYFILIVRNSRRLETAGVYEWEDFVSAAPFRMLLPLIPSVVVMSCIAGFLDASGESSVLLYLSPIVYAICAITTVIVGYAYILFFGAQLWLLQRMGVVEE